MKSVSLAELPTEIERRGGIEAVVKMAAGHDSRRLKKKTQKRDKWDDDGDVTIAPVRSRAALSSVNSWVESSFRTTDAFPEFDMDQQLRARFKKIEVGGGVKVFAFRDDEDPDVFQVTKVVPIKQKDEP